MRLSAVLVLCLTTVVVGQTPARDAVGANAAVASGTARLAGVVLDENGEPGRRVPVTIASGTLTSFTARTNEQGQFTFENLPGGRFTVTANKPGYPSMSYGATRPDRPGSGVLLADGQQVAGIAIRLVRGVSISGTVLDEHGEPLPGIAVMPWEVRTSLAGDRTLAFPSTGGVSVVSDDRGHYRFFGLPPGDYTVGTSWSFGGSRQTARVLLRDEIDRAFTLLTQPASVSATPSQTRTPAASPAQPLYGYTAVYYPSELDPLAAVTLSLGPGEAREGVDLRMRFQAMASVRATLAGPSGPTGNARMTFATRSSVSALNSALVTVAQPNGQFIANSVAPGDYTLIAEVPGTATEDPLCARTDLTVRGADPVQIALDLQPCVVLSGRITLNGSGTPPNLANVRVGLGRVSNSSPMGNALQPAPVDAAGVFTLRGVTPGSYRLTATIPASPGSPSWRLDGATLNGGDVTDLPLDIDASTTGEITMSLSDQISRLSGFVRVPAGTAPSDFFIVVFPADSRYWMEQTRRISSARPDATGRYEFAWLPPGDYRVAATMDLIPDDLRDRSAMGRLLQSSVSVSISRNQSATLDLELGGR